MSWQTSMLPSGMTELTVPHVVGLSIFTSYFLLILLLLYTILSSIRRNAKIGANRGPAVIFGGLTISSFAHTWFWMFRFLAWSFQNYENALKQRDARLIMRVASWLKDTALFEQAWSAVCTGPMNWWWSEQLCLFTAGAFTVFLYLQRGRVPHVWAYMVLGQVVAISVALSLVNLALVIIPPPPMPAKTRHSRAPLSLTIPVLLSMLTISFSPYTSPTTFLPNLLAMHAFLILPLLPLPPVSPRNFSPNMTSFYTLLSLLSLLLRTRTTLAVLSALHITSSPLFSWRFPADTAFALWNAPANVYVQAWAVLHAHPAQASIGWDVVWTGVVWLAWGALTRWKAATVAKNALQGTFASVAVIAPLEFTRALREYEGQGETKEE